MTVYHKADRIENYKDAKNVFDAAVIKKGIVVYCDNPRRLQGRMHRFRALDRLTQGRSQYDIFLLRIEDGTLLVEPRQEEKPVLPSDRPSDLLNP